MACISFNEESPRRDFGYSSQLTNWILDSGLTFHMTSDISEFIPGSLVETDKYIKFSDGSLVTEKQTGGFQIKMRDDNGKTFIAMLYNILLAPDL